MNAMRLYVSLKPATIRCVWAQVTVTKDDTVLFTKQGSSDVPVGRDGEVCFVQERAILARLS